MKRLITLGLGVLLSLEVFARPALAHDSWASFQNGGQVSLDTTAPTAGTKPRWTVELAGYGQSTPVVWHSHIYVTSIEGGNKDTCHVAAYSLTDGKQLWRHAISNATPHENNEYVSRAAPSPAADDAGVICLFEGGNLVALTHDGKIRWERNLVVDYGAIVARHGLAASVEQSADHVFIWMERSEEPYVVCLKKSSGETRWKVPGVGATSWASPRLVPVDGGQHLVLSASGSLMGLDPTDGSQLWKLEELTGNSTPTPMPLGDGKFLIGATVGRGESGSGRAAESNGMVQISRTADGIWKADYVWRARRATSSFASPIVHEGVALFVNREGVLYGLEAAAGDELFAKRLSGSSWATAIGLCNGSVLVPARDGKIDVVNGLKSDLTVTTLDPIPVAAKDKKDPVPAAGSPTNSGPPGSKAPVLYAAVVVRDSLLLRQGDRLICLALNSDDTAVSAP
ncbi:MAG: PQQ-binding-like beta-propeller repeat protein [Planctomycetaceae bacterium]|nr:PQQ-binding-like beta-propeller repeat protein [Planctomycetaceae bacterium]